MSKKEIRPEEFLALVRESRLPLLDEVAAKELGTSAGALNSLVAGWLSERQVSDGELFVGRISFNRAYSTDADVFRTSLDGLETELESYVGRGIIFPSNYLRKWFAKYYTRRFGVFIHWNLVTATSNQLVAEGRLLKMRRFGLEEDLSTSIYHPTRAEFVNEAIAHCEKSLALGKPVPLDELVQLAARLPEPEDMGRDFAPDFWVYSISGYLEYRGIATTEDANILAPGART